MHIPACTGAEHTYRSVRPKPGCPWGRRSFTEKMPLFSSFWRSETSSTRIFSFSLKSAANSASHYCHSPLQQASRCASMGAAYRLRSSGLFLLPHHLTLRRERPLLVPPRLLTPQQMVSYDLLSLVHSQEWKSQKRKLKKRDNTHNKTPAHPHHS